MSDDDSDLLNKLLQSIADGEPVDWNEIEKLSADEELRQLLRQLRVVADVADLHRSHIEDGTPEDAVTTKPQTPAGSPGATGRRPLLLSKAPEGSLGHWGPLLLLRKIGEGAFGEVYHAHDTWLDHPVALKLLKPQIAGIVSPTRMLHEARRLARVRHPNVVTVHGADKHDGRVGFWMDFVEGQTLAELVAEGRLSSGEAGHIGQEVCRALAAVHQAKLIHRDVKAQNVMRASDGGRIILMDFGAGEFMDNLPVGSRVRGTPLYLAPELFANGIACIQTDIYSVGVLLYYLVTGGFPVHGQSVDALAEAHRRGTRRALRDSRPDLPDPFVTIVERALDPDPMRRYPSASEMLTALAESTAPVVVSHDAGGRKRTALQQVGRATVAALAVGLAIEALGFTASRTFELTVRMDPDFTAGLGEYFVVGARALIPFAVYWVVAGALLGLLIGLLPLFRPTIRAVRTRWMKWTISFDPTVSATLMLLAAAGAWVVLTWAFRDLFAAVDALYTATAGTPVDVSILSPAARDYYRRHSELSAGLSLLLGVVAWRVFPRFERQAKDAVSIRSMKWLTVGIAFLVVATAVLPRRLIWDRFEVVTFENQQALVIGTYEDEVLLYAPFAGERPRWRVRTDAPALSRTGLTRQLFDPPQK